MKEKVIPLLKKNWQILLIVFCLSAGSGMIFTTRHLFPVFLDLVIYKMRQDEPVVVESRKIGVKPAEPIPGYRFFLPLISQSGALETYDDVKQDQALPGLVAEKPMVVIEIDDGGKPVTISISTDNDEPVKITFLPGAHCAFGDGRGCVYQFLSTNGKQVVFVSVHSGTGGQADGFRHMIEGTGFNQGLYNSKQVLQNARSLSGADVTFLQGDYEIDGLALDLIVRIPPEYLDSYMSLPVEQSL
jgi:hypothetical protein